MDKQDTLRNLVIAAFVFIILMAVGPRLLPPPPISPPKPDDAAPTLTSDAASTDGAPTVPPSPDASAESINEPAPKKDVRGGWSIVEAPEAQTVYIGAGEEAGKSNSPKNEPYRMRLRLSNIGASVETVTLTDHAARLKSPDRYELLSLLERPGGQTFRSFAVERINIDGQDLDISTKKWRLAAHDRVSSADQESDRVEFTLEIHRENVPALRLTRVYELPAQPIDMGRHDLNVSLSIGNVSDQPHRVVTIFTGGVGIKQSDPRMDNRAIDIGVIAPTGIVSPARNTLASVASNPRLSLPLFALTASAPDQFLSWAAMGETYFTCTVAPVERDGRSTGKYLVSASGVDLDGNSLTTDDVTIRLVTAETSLAPAASLHYATSIYLGEKDGRAFRDQPDYAARNYYFQISQGFGWCTFNWLVELMIRLLNGLYSLIPDYGVAIIILVLLVRAMLHPITKKGQINMVRMQHRMQELQPKIEEIKRKYANDKVRMNQEMMKLDLNPAGQIMTCIPMFIQMPIWVALYLSLSNNIDMRHQPFLFTWIRDLTAPDALIPFSQPFVVPLFGWRIASFNLLPLLLTIFTYTQQKLQPKPAQPANMSEQQRAQQEMMQRMIPIMSVMMLFIFYNAPSGLTLYVMASSLFGTIEQWWIRKHIKEREASGTLHKPRVPKSGERVGSQIQKMKPGWLQRLQQMAEEAQKAQHNQRTKTKR